MKQTARIISTYSADTFGVCSALFELGGMSVMHDASGCNSTYTTHDEPRWYDMDSMVYISGLSEMEAVMGDDEKLISDIVTAAQELHPKFIAIAGTPIPAMTGFDFDAVARIIEDRTGIPTMGFETTGMNTYIHGASMALAGLARRFVRGDVQRTEKPSVNILGLTPLDFSVNGTDRAIADFLSQNGWQVLSNWAMGSTLEDIENAGAAHVNLVVSAAGLEAARILKRRFGTPCIVGVPYGKAWSEQIAEALQTGESRMPELEDDGIVIIGEGVTSLSLAQAIEMETGRGTRVVCPTECDRSVLRKKDIICHSEEEIEGQVKSAKLVIADPLYRPVCPGPFLSLPSEAFSGRIYRANIPNLVTDFESFIREVLRLPGPL